MKDDQLMGQGGSYTLDPNTHTLTLVERTLMPDEVLPSDAPESASTEVGVALNPTQIKKGKG